MSTKILEIQCTEDDSKRTAVNYAKNVILNCIDQEVRNLEKRGVIIDHVYISTPFIRVEEIGKEVGRRIFSPSVAIDYR